MPLKDLIPGPPPPPPSNIAFTRAPLGGNRLLQLHKRDPILEWCFFLELQLINGAFTENEHRNFHSHRQIPCPPHECQWHSFRRQGPIHYFSNLGNRKLDNHQCLCRLLFKRENINVETVEWSESSCRPLHPRWWL